MKLVQRILLALGLKQQETQNTCNAVVAPLPIAPASTPGVPPIVAPATMAQKAAALTTAMAIELDGYWSSNQNKVEILAKGTMLWHGGIIGPELPASDDIALWTTRDPEKKADYNGWAYDDAKRLEREAYLTEFKSNRDLRLACFMQKSMHSFTVKQCGGSHNSMKAAVTEWLESKSLDGIAGINSGADEVVVKAPASDLLVSSQTLIQPIDG